MLNLLVVYRCIWVLLFVGMVRASARRGVVWQSLNSWLSFAQQQKLTFDKGDSAFLGIALLGFGIPFNNVAAINAGDNQRD